MEKVKAAKIFHSRSLSDRERPEPALAGPLARSQSEIGINREFAEFEASFTPCVSPLFSVDDVPARRTRSSSRSLTSSCVLVRP